MKAFLEFDLDLPDDERRMAKYMKAPAALLVIADMAEALRSKIKYSDDAVERKYAEYWQSVFNSFLDHREVYPEDYYE